MPSNLKIPIFIGFRHLFRGLTPLKIKNFDQKLKISTNTNIFAHNSSRETLINNSLHHTMKLENSYFYWISPLISWANTFKNQEFRLKISTNTNFFAHNSSWESLI